MTIRRLPLLLAAFVLIAGCRTRPQPPRQDVEVIFCTNRDKGTGPRKPFSIARANPTWGRVVVEIEGASDDDPYPKLLSGKPVVKFPYQPIQPAEIAALPGSELLVFIHGYFNSFEESIQSAARLRTRLKIDGPAVAFCWPSMNKLEGYLYDVETAVWATSHAAEMLKQIIDAAGTTKRIHLFSHSMGTRIMLGALSQLALEDSRQPLRPDGPPYFDRLIMAAPDVDAELFRQSWVPQVHKLGKRYVVYASDRDEALARSADVHRTARAGRMGPWRRMVRERRKTGDELPKLLFEVVDVGRIDTSDFGHVYYRGGVRQVMQDMEALLHDEQRRLALRDEAPFLYFIPGSRRDFLEIGH